MTEPSWKKGPPATILLATDLSPRCDRALDRAAQLAAQWNAGLVVVHAVDPKEAETAGARDLPSWRRPPDPERVAFDRLCAELTSQSCSIDCHVETGRPADVVLEVAARTNAGLIVTGVARDEPLGRMLFGDTVQRLMRSAPVPLLIARNRPRTPYRSIVVATDFSPSSRHALEAATRLFEQANFILFNGYEVPFASYLTAEQIEAGFRRLEEEVGNSFLAEADIPDAVRKRIGLLVEHGPPERLLHEYVREHRIDLTVVGTHGGGAVYELVIGSTAGRIIDAVEGDVLVVREPRAI